MNVHISLGQFGLAILTFLYALLIIFKPEKVISTKKLAQIKKENYRIYTLEHGITYIELSLLFIIMMVIEPYFTGTAVYMYLTIFILAIVILFLKLYALDKKYLNK